MTPTSSTPGPPRSRSMSTMRPDARRMLRSASSRPDGARTTTARVMTPSSSRPTCPSRRMPNIRSTAWSLPRRFAPGPSPAVRATLPARRRLPTQVRSSSRSSPPATRLPWPSPTRTASCARASSPRPSTSTRALAAWCPRLRAASTSRPSSASSRRRSPRRASTLAATPWPPPTSPPSA